jgi:hypothetical protein
MTEIIHMDGVEENKSVIGLIETIGGGRLHNCEMGAGRCGNIVQPAK